MEMTRGPAFQHSSLPQLLITTQQSNDSVAIALVGELDIAIAADVAATVEAIVANSAITAMHFDGTGVTFADSSGLRTLMRARQVAVANGLAFSLRVAPGGQVDSVIEMSGLHDRLVDYRPEPAAL